MKKTKTLYFSRSSNKLRGPITSKKVKNESDEITNGRASMIQHQIALMILHRIAHMSLYHTYDGAAPPEEVLSNITIFEKESDEDYEIFIDDG